MISLDVKVLIFISIGLLARPVLLQEEEDMAMERARRFQEMLKHDGVKRTVTMTDKNYNSLIRKKDLVVSLFYANQGDAGRSAQDVELLEVAAQVFAGKVLCTVCDMISNPEVMEKAGIKYSGVVKIYNHGKQAAFHGQRSPDLFVPYLSKLFEPSVTVINSKTEKKQFDNQELPKIVAYVAKDSSEMRALKAASLYYQPMIPFYAVTDAKLAKSLHLKKVNSLQVVKPFERPVTMSNKVRWDEKQLVDFIEANKRELMKKLRLENVHEVWAVDNRGFVVPAFAATNTHAGKRFLSLCKTVAKNFKSNEELSFIWIDPESFPMMSSYWQDTFNVDPSSPTIGAIHVPTQRAAWLKIDDVDSKTVPKQLNQWMTDLVAGKVELLPIKTGDSETSADQEQENEAKQEL